MANVFDLWGKISIDTSGFTKALSIANRAITMSVKAITNFASSSVKTGMTFDKSMSQVAATLGKTVDEVQDLREFAQKMGSETAFSASQSADALNYMALAGYDAETSMSMLPNVLNLAAAGGMELANASDMITDTQSALGLSLEETSQLVDKMAKASSKSNTSVSQLGSAMLTVGGTAKMLSGGTTELATALGILADNGTKGAEGGTALRNVLLGLSSGKFEENFGALGIQAYDASGNMRELKDILADMNTVMEGMTEQEKTSLISDTFNKADLKNVNALLDTTIDRWDELTTEIDNASGAAGKMAETQLDNLEGSITKFKSALEGVQIEISEKLNPTLKDFVDVGVVGLSDITAAFKNGGLQSAMTEIGTFLSKAVGMITQKMPEFVGAGVNILIAMIKGITDNTSTIIDAIVETVPILIEGITETLPDLIDGFFKLVVGIAEGLIDLLPQILPQIIEIVTKIANMLVENIDSVVDAAIEIVEVLSEALIDNLPTIIEATLTILEKVLDYVTKPENITKIVEMAAKVIISVATALMAAVPKLLVGIGKIISKVIDNIVNTDWSQLGKDLMNNITKELQKASKKLAEWWDGWSQEIGKYAVIAWNGVVDAFSGIGNWFTDRWNDVKKAFSDVGNWFKDIFEGAWENIKGAFSNVKTFFSDVWEGIKSVFSKVGDWFKNIFSTAWENIKNVFSSTGNTFNSIGNSILSGLKSIVNSLISGINDIITIPFNGLNSALKGIRDIDIFGNKPFSWIGEVSIPKIPYLAQGGVLKKGQMAFLEGQGDEAVVPLSQNTEWIDKIAEKLSNKQQPSYSINISIENMGQTSEDNIEEFAEKLMEIITQKNVRERYAL